MREEKKKKGTQFAAVRVNPKLIVEQCAAPLESVWASSVGGFYEKSVQVVCKSTLHEKKVLACSSANCSISQTKELEKNSVRKKCLAAA